MTFALRIRNDSEARLGWWPCITLRLNAISTTSKGEFVAPEHILSDVTRANPDEGLGLCRTRRVPSGVSLVAGFRLRFATTAPALARTRSHRTISSIILCIFSHCERHCLETYRCAGGRSGDQRSSHRSVIQPTCVSPSEECLRAEGSFCAICP